MKNHMSNDLISVIVPCYNVEKYLEKCVKSILDQTYKNLEIILVDDGATDSTPELCDKLAQTDKRITVIHKQNGGLSDARNAGIAVAQGKYITFFDSDDWIEPDTIKIAYGNLTKNNLDLIIWGYAADFVDESENILHSRLCKLDGICEKGADNSVLLEKNALGLSGYAWNKLYKTAIIKEKKLSFKKGVSLVEDILFNSSYFCNCKKIAFIDCIGNHYIQRGRVTLGNGRYENVFELKLAACNAREKILNYFGIGEKIISKVMSSFYYGVLNSAIKTIINTPGSNRVDITKNLKNFLAKTEVQEVAKKAMRTPLKQHILVILVRLRAAEILLKIKK